MRPAAVFRRRCHFRVRFGAMIGPSHPVNGVRERMERSRYFKRPSATSVKRMALPTPYRFES